MRKIKNKSLIVLILALIGLFFATSSPMLQPAGATSPQIPWGNDSYISNFNNLTAADPSVVTDSDGNAHIIWMQKTSNLIGEIFYTKLDKFGSTLISNRQLTNFSGVYGFPMSASIDRFDNIHMAWIWDVTGTSLHGIRYLRMDSNGNIIVNDSILQNAPGWEIATDSQGNVIVVGGGDTDVYYAKYDNQGNVLVPRTLVTNTTVWEPLNLKILIDSNDVAHILWMDELTQSPLTSYRIKYSSMGSNGSILVNGLQLDQGTNASENPSLAIDKNNNVIFSWDSYINGSRNVYFSKKTSNGTFVIDKKQVLANSGGWFILTDPLGRINFFQYNHNFIQLDSLGNIIIQPILIGLGGQGTLYKGFTDRQGNMHLVWYEGPYNTARVKYRKSLNPATISMQGVPRPGSKVTFILQDSYALKASYVLGISTNISQGMMLPDGRVTPLDNTPLLQTSLSNPQSIGLFNSIGRLRPDKAKVTLAIPNNVSLSNSTFYTSFVTLDSSGGVVTISDPLAFTII